MIKRKYTLRPLLCQDLEYTDLTFKCPGYNEIIHAHRLVLQLSSPMLQKCFQEEGGDDATVILPAGVKPNTMLNLVMFVYSGKIITSNSIEKDELVDLISDLGIELPNLEIQQSNLEIQQQTLEIHEAVSENQQRQQISDELLAMHKYDKICDKQVKDISVVKVAKKGNDVDLNISFEYNNEDINSFDFCTDPVEEPRLMVRSSRSLLKPRKEFQFACDLCELFFQRKETYEEHRKSHLQSESLTCEICHKVFEKRGTFNAHMRTHERPYNCIHCDMSFGKNSTLLAHSRVHTGERPYVCDICEKDFPSKSGLTSHKKQTHTINDKPWTCDVCSAGFISNAALTAHSRRHTKEKPWICETCGKGFSTKQNMSDHTRLHSGMNPYVCNKCGLNFKWKQALVRHLIDHTGVRPHPCPQCAVAFKTSNCLKKHMISVHSGVKQFVCQHCQSRFSTSSGMFRHQRKFRCSALKNEQAMKMKQESEQPERRLQNDPLHIVHEQQRTIGEDLDDKPDLISKSVVFFY